MIISIPASDILLPWIASGIVLVHTENRIGPATLPFGTLYSVDDVDVIEHCRFALLLIYWKGAIQTIHMQCYKLKI